MAQKVVPRVYRGYFEYLYALSSDPWKYLTSSYEAAKYDRTINAMRGLRLTRALEVGCSIGVFTKLLASRCDNLVAVDISGLAVRRARRRLAGLSHVTVQRRTLPDDMPHGKFDLIVCSEVLYYWNKKLLLKAVHAFEAALAPGGMLIAVHGRLTSHTCPLTGDEVHDLLRRNCALDNSLSVIEGRYRLDRFEKATKPV